jgi:hypothetical protein
VKQLDPNTDPRTPNGPIEQTNAVGCGEPKPPRFSITKNRLQQITTEAIGLLKELPRLPVAVNVEGDKVPPAFLFGPVTYLQRRVLDDLDLELGRERVRQIRREAELDEQARALGLPEDLQERWKVAERGDDGQATALMNEWTSVGKEWERYQRRHQIKRAAVLVAAFRGDWGQHNPALEGVTWPALTIQSPHDVVLQRVEFLLHVEDQDVERLLMHVEDGIRQGMTRLLQEEKKKFERSLSLMSPATPMAGGSTTAPPAP